MTHWISIRTCPLCDTQDEILELQDFPRHLPDDETVGVMMSWKGKVLPVPQRTCSACKKFSNHNYRLVPAACLAVDEGEIL